MIRTFNPEDINQVIGLLEALRQETPYRCIKPDWPQIVNVVTNASSKRTGLVLVAEHDGKITGVLIAIAQTLWWQEDRTGARIASDLIFYSKRLGDGRRMLRQMIDWAFTVPRVVRVECGISSGQNPERMEALYLSAGFVREGTFYVCNHPRYASAFGGDQLMSAQCPVSGGGGLSQV
jgi:hypothetical protein